MTTPVAAVPFEVDLSVTPSSGVFNYALTARNTGLVDVTLLSLVDAPPGDALINSSLFTPPGFLGLYDSGLGIIDFLEDTSLFAAGTTIGGFGFSSLSGTGTYFTRFEALDVEGGLISGRINVVGGGGQPSSVSDDASSLVLAAFGLWAVTLARALSARSHRRGRTAH